CNAARPCHTVIHNAGIFRPNAPRLETVDGLEDTFAVNALAPYLLTALIASPQRSVFLSSELHQIGQPDLSDLQSRRRWSGFQAYSNSKLFVVALAFGVARVGVTSCRMRSIPGWFPRGWVALKPPITSNWVSRRRSGCRSR